MSERPAETNRDLLAMRSAGHLAELLAEVDELEVRLHAAPQWRPGRALAAQAAWLRGQLAAMDLSAGSKLVVAIVGPSGAGKSTLLNALAGRELSPAGLERPTTREVVVYTAAAAEAEAWAARLGGEAVRVAVAPGAVGLEHLILIDTPDTNTTPENQRLLARALAEVDLLLAVFPVQNPKLMDNIAFLEPYVRQLPADAVVPVLNMVDRVPADELRGEVLPDFRRAIQAMWGLPDGRIYLISARAALPGAQFAADEAPLHAVNEFADLRRLIYEHLNRAGQAVDRRLARGEHLLAALREACAGELAASAAGRAEAGRALDGLAAESRAALQTALAGGSGRRGGLDLHAALFGRLAARWWGPVGWLVALWSLVLRAGSWMGHLGRRDSRDGDVALAGLPPAEEWAAALQGVGAERWPAVGDALVRAGFTDAARESARWQEIVARAGRDLGQRVGPLLAARLDRLAARLAAGGLQALLNLPAVGLAGWVGAETVLSFFQRAVLSADYFRQAGIAILAVWLAAFLLLQGIVSLSLRHALRRGLADDLTEAATAGLLAEWRAELAAVAALARILPGVTGRRERERGGR